jgi:hypothetical protein
MTAPLGLAPLDHKATGDELVAIHASVTAHPNALRHELTRTAPATLVRLAYGEHAPEPLFGVPDALASMAYDEMERRRGALSRLLADNPSLRGL